MLYTIKLMLDTNRACFDLRTNYFYEQTKERSLFITPGIASYFVSLFVHRSQDSLVRASDLRPSCLFFACPVSGSFISARLLPSLTPLKENALDSAFETISDGD